MAVALAAIAAFGFYLCAVPVKFALSVRIHSGARAGAAIAAFEGRWALRRAARRALEAPKARRSGPKLDLSCALPAALKALKYLFRHLKLETLRAEGAFGARDAAQTALICGCARAIKRALAPVSPPGMLRVRVEPDFHGGGELTLCGMISLRLGHIICAAILCAAEYILRRLRHGKASH